MAEAIVWFRIQAMKTEREPRDQYFIESEFSRALARAYSFRQTGDLLSAWREYGQIVTTYDSLVDTAAVRAKADALATDKTLRDAAKRERSQFEEQSKLTDDIVARMAVPPEPDSRVQADQELQDRLLRLRRNADQETRADRAVVYKRALAGVFVAAMESGNGYVEVKKIDLAVRTYTVATQAKPDSEWAWEQLAVAQALAANRKGAIAALSRARDLARDKAGFMKWLDSEHAFESLRSSPGFQALSDSSPGDYRPQSSSIMVSTNVNR
jgi:predicted Zn-dependent protease